MGNKGALIRFKGSEMEPKFVQYTAVVYFNYFQSHPNVPAMKYSNQWMFF